MRFKPVAVLAVLVVGGCTAATPPSRPSSVTVATSSATAPITPARSSPPPGPTTRPRTTAPASLPASSTPAASPAPRPLSAAARRAGLVDIHTVDADPIVDLRYATPHNFVGTRLYPVDAHCLVHESMAPGLRVAARWFHRHGYVLVYWDCYRPHAVQVRMFRIVPNPAWVAKPGPYATSHESGRSVDVTLARAVPSSACPASRRVQRHCTLDMGTGFDDFTPRAYAYATDVSARARHDRALLPSGMAAGGLVVYAGEWWHFDGPGSGTPRPILHAPLH